MSHYDTLGVGQNATPAQIKAAYRKLASKTHPDRAPEGDRAKCEAAMKDINAAYATLGDAKKRAKYDSWFGGRQSTSGAKKTRKEQPKAAPKAARKAKAKPKKAPEEAPYEEPKAAPTPQYDFNKVANKHLCASCNGAGSLMIAAGMANRRTPCYGCRGSGINLLFASEYSTI